MHNRLTHMRLALDIVTSNALLNYASSKAMPRIHWRNAVFITV